MVKPKNSFEKVHTLTRRKNAQQLQLWFVRAVGPWSKCVGLPHENLREDRALDVRFASESRHVHCTSPCLLWAKSGHARLFDHLVGRDYQTWRNGKTKCLGRFQVESCLKFGRRLHRKFTGFRPAQDTVNICGGL